MPKKLKHLWFKKGGKQHASLTQRARRPYVPRKPKPTKEGRGEVMSVILPILTN